METLIEYVEILGAVAFSISGAAKAIKNDMDLFGTIVLAVTTVIGGGMFRDIMLGHTPPSAHYDPFTSAFARGGGCYRISSRRAPCDNHETQSV